MRSSFKLFVVVLRAIAYVACTFTIAFLFMGGFILLSEAFRRIGWTMPTAVRWIYAAMTVIVSYRLSGVIARRLVPEGFC